MSVLALLSGSEAYCDVELAVSFLPEHGRNHPQRGGQAELA